MYRDIGRTAHTQNKRLIAHATLDTALNILSFSPELQQWSYIRSTKLIGISLFDLFPLLEIHQIAIFKHLQNSGAVFTYQNARFTKNLHSDKVFDIQIEHFPGIHDRLLLTIIPSFTPSETTNTDQNFLKLTRYNRDLLLLNEASQALTATLDIDEVLERLLQVTVQIINATGSSVWLWEDEHQEELVCQAAFHPGTEEKLLGLCIRSGNGIVGWVAMENEGAIVSDPTRDGRFYPHIDNNSGFTTTSILAVPIHLRNRVLGVLEVVNKQNGRFQPHDLTYAKMLAASAAIAIDNAQLIQALRQKMTDLKAQNAELAAFDHTVAHDLQNPLALVVGFADLLQSSSQDISREEQEHALNLLTQNAHRMSNIIQEMLVLSSVRKRDIETHPMEMAHVVEQALDRLRFAVQEHSATVILPESWPVAAGYAPWIEEVWENYIGNAMKYGGAPPIIELGSTILTDGRIKFWVKDNGQGIDPEKQHLLFTPFT
ncbi:MAG: GAF domain-containing protein, partial [Anaerolineales bacterium]|nr:GAF domain-containing protein [Anaerolineales bacterium]